MPSTGHRLTPTFQLYQQKFRVSPLLVRVIFVLLLLLGSLIVSDYGVSYDEYVNRKNGGVSLNHIVETIEKNFNVSLGLTDEALAAHRIPLNTYLDRDYGVAFDLPAFVIERALQVNSVRGQHVLRHILTYLFFLVGCWALYKTVALRFSSTLLGLASVAMMVLSPRIFADSFYNSKDIVFMSAVAIATYAMQRLFDKKDLASALLFGFVTAFAINIRIIGIIFPIALIAIVSIGLLTRKQPLRASLLFFYLAVSTGLTIVFWPWLWSNPIDHFMLAFSNMSKFRWDGWILYLGNYYPSTNLPRHYLITWIIISTPVVYLLLFGVGACSIIKKTIANKFDLWRNPSELQDLIFLGLFFSPVVLVLIYRPVLYDGWRQFYFIYPVFICLAIRGLALALELKSSKGLRVFRTLLLSAFGATLIYVAQWMITHHPHQNLYFNALTPKDSAQSLDSPSQIFELDYWGTTNVRALRYLLQYKASGTIRVGSLGITSLHQSLAMLDDADKARIQIVPEVEDAEFYITNFRYIIPQQREFLQDKRWSLIHRIIVDQRTVSSVFQKNSE